MSPQPTDKQLELLVLIDDLNRAGRVASVRELSHTLRVTKSTVHARILALRRKGMLAASDFGARGHIVSSVGQRALSVERETMPPGGEVSVELGLVIRFIQRDLGDKLPAISGLIDKLRRGAHWTGE